MFENPRRISASMIAFLTVLFLSGCGAGQDQVKKDLEDLKKEVSRLTARQDLLEQELASRATAETKAREQAAAPAVSSAPSAPSAPSAVQPVASPGPGQQTGLSIPTLPVVKFSEPKADASGGAQKELKEPGPENEEIQGAVQPESNADPARIFTRGTRQFAEKDCGNAVVTFEEFLRVSPSNPKAPQAVMNIGECYYRRGEFAIALSEFTRLEQQYQDSKLVPMSIYKAGMCLKNLKDPKGARDTFLRLTRTYPGNEAAVMAEKELARLK